VIEGNDALVNPEGLTPGNRSAKGGAFLSILKIVCIPTLLIVPFYFRKEIYLTSE
jgi:hypothetical protein